MNKDLIASQSVEIKASATSVWLVLTNPKEIQKFLFGTQTTTDWKEGSPILFEGEFNGTKYQDKGFVLKNKPNRELEYSYWSGFSGLDDVPENYSNVHYSIEHLADDKVKFTWTQTGFSSEDGQCHTQEGLKSMLAKIKELAES